jgi:general nucleoside transport system permease protein
MEKFLKKLWTGDQPILIPIISIILSFLVVGIILILTGRNPIEAYYYFIKGSFGNLYNITDTFSRVTPLAIAGCAFVVAARCGIFNVGIEGQLLLGGLASAIVGYAVHLPAIIHLPLMLLTGMVFGGLYAFIPGWMKTYRGINEILSTIMLNYPAFYLVHYLTVKKLQAPGVVPATPLIDKTAELPLLVPDSRMHAGIIIAVLVAIAVYYLLFHTVLGYEMRAVGINKDAARYNGIPVEKRMILAMVISGALAGLAGAVEIAGVHHRFLDQFSPGYGYDSITVSLVGLSHPFGTFVAAIFFGALKTGNLEMAIFTNIPRQLVSLLTGIVMLFIASQNLLRNQLRAITRKEIKQ